MRSATNSVNMYLALLAKSDGVEDPVIMGAEEKRLSKRRNTKTERFPHFYN